jgi:hypothetical protein
MRPRLARTDHHDDLSRRAFRTLLGPLCLIGSTVIAAVLLSSWSAGPDLFDLAPKAARLDDYELVAWFDLERAPRTLSVGAVASGARIRALGYMMEGGASVRAGRTVGRFVLLPSAGHALGPPHRFGDRMIDVRLAAGDGVRFFEGSLVWVWGTLRILPGDPAGHQALYVLEDARTEPAHKADIPKYFR